MFNQEYQSNLYHKLDAPFYKFEIKSYDDMLQFVKQQSVLNEKDILANQKVNNDMRGYINEANRAIDFSKKQKKMLEIDQSFEAWFAQILGDKAKINAFDLINIIRPDRMIIAWVLTIFKLVFALLAVLIFGLFTLIPYVTSLLNKNK